MNRSLAIACSFVIASATALASTLHVGAGQQYADPARASRDARPGDTILIHGGTYRGTFWIEGLEGTADAPIVIRGEDRALVRMEGGIESMHLTDCAYIKLETMTITRQEGNGMNIDDAGTIDTPTHHITLRDMTFVSMDASDNNDMLKLSGLVDFVIDSCTFTDGSERGSGIDMVGCQRGVIQRCVFERQGSNAIHAKGGTRYVRILRNRFIDAGQRAVNLGGSTGLQFFRPIDATFEAADLQVHANLFIRSVAPIAYVGAVRVDVSNNTIIDPERWVFRVLQETVDPSRFAPCGQNVFRNNIVVMRNTLSTHVNIGPNTAPETFLLTTNLWYMIDNVGRSRPAGLPMTEQGGLYGVDPMIASTTDPNLLPGSPAIGAGSPVDGLDRDLLGRPYAVTPSIGAIEGQTPSAVCDMDQTARPRVTRTSDGWLVVVPHGHGHAVIDVYDVRGRLLRTLLVDEGSSDMVAAATAFVVVR